jgi:GT2 family glycosyltransferase
MSPAPDSNLAEPLDSSVFTDVTIIVPVYQGLAQTKACLDSLVASLQNVSGAYRVLVINDASPDPEMPALLETFAHHAFEEVRHNPKNLGFVATVNQGMQACTGDVILLNSDTIVPEGWLERLAAAVQAHPKGATFTPLSNNATICSYPAFPQGAPVASDAAALNIDKACASAHQGLAVDIPTGVGFCFYIRRSALEALGYFDEEAFGLGYGEENDFCRKAVAQGFTNYLVPGVYVQHLGGCSFGDKAQGLQAHALSVIQSRYPDYDYLIGDFVVSGALEPVFAAIDTQRIALGEEPDHIAQEQQARQQWLQEHTLQQCRHLLGAHFALGQETKSLRDRIAHYEQRCEQYDLLLKNSREDYMALEERCRGWLTEQREAYKVLETAFETEQVRRIAAEQTLTHLTKQWIVRYARKFGLLRGPL